MHKHKDLIRYHLHSAMELAGESGLPTLQYLTALALAENDDPEGIIVQRTASNEVTADTSHLLAS